jgi:hypothetical protein
MCKELVLELKKRSDATFERYYPRVGMVVPGELFCDTECKELISTYHFIFIETMKKLSDIRSNCEKEIELLKSELKRFEIQLY